MLTTKTLAFLLKVCVAAVCTLLPASAAVLGNMTEKLTVSGLFKVDAIYDLEAPSGDRINYASIPTTDSDDQRQARIHARETRIGLTYRDKFDRHPFVAYVEGDFYGGGTNSPSGSENITNATDFALRHAYLSFGNWLVGQTWSNYVDVSSFPETLDFSNDTGQAFVRQGQIRYQIQGNDLAFFLALENPETDVILVEETLESVDSLSEVDSLFDLTARAKYQGDWGHVSLQSVARSLEVSTENRKERVLGIGVGVSGKIHLTSRDLIKFHYSHGNGIGRYIQEASGSAGAAFQSQQNRAEGAISLDRLKARGGYFAYQHRFSQFLRANLSSGVLQIDLDDTQAAIYLQDNTKKLSSFHGNVIWTPYPKFEIGLEYAVANVTKLSGAQGSVKRIQFSTMYRF